ncbi:carbohydrate sulfotransferase 12-like [Mya arenaria]|uniref:carbohydrate sulfotransferase 12-like n=1 Tax=Mya arenaria TaxID=6604 RepID=UPI0022E7BB40|nr:carbohydrate sulfotransferase 12-like [Mya arenaria]
MLQMRPFRPSFARLGLVLMVALMALYVFSGRQRSLYFSSEAGAAHIFRPNKCLLKYTNVPVYNTTVSSTPIYVSPMSSSMFPLVSRTKDLPPPPARLDNGIRIQKTVKSVADDTEELTNEFAQMEKEQRLQIDKLTQVCSTNVLQNATYAGMGSYKYHRSRAYNVGYCKVPKCGSTFWIRLFTVLDNGINVAKNILEKSRSSLHNMRHSFHSSLLSILQLKSPTILSARNPYSRLHSAYIDKLYLFLMWNYSLNILGIDKTNTTERICPQAVSFEDFLQWILRDASQGKTLNRHWAPIFSLCKPCDVVPISIIRQETFAKDVKFILQYLKVDEDKYEFIMSALQGNRVKTALPSIIATVFNRVKSLVRDNCLNWIYIARRTWSALQIQGFIANEVNFPFEQFKNLTDPSDVVKVSEFIISEIYKHPLSKDESHNQRKMALQAAYSDVSEETIVGIQQLYREDFLLFGYSFVPPNKEDIYSE